MAIAVGGIFYKEPHHHFAYSDFYSAAGYSNFAFLVLLVFEAPLLFILIDEAAGEVKYQRLFRNISAVTLNYGHVTAEFTTRYISRNNSAKVWALYYNGDEQFYVHIHNGWTERKLTAIHNLVKHVV
ncbi:hypothetical protein [Hymenobacter armeniacus]|uniref:Uncharacterized protein n=1 Tax=Hymenobacter armeniacus TaxID=2771358 RepID=A0ABR8JMG5_9BACT|nr:hypothetical protein [Hymenobacter armeniacus]MBD2721192.1 hypothetical protein [Hymenobacter armeniacus]